MEASIRLESHDTRWIGDYGKCRATFRQMAGGNDETIYRASEAYVADPVTHGNRVSAKVARVLELRSERDDWLRQIST